MYTDRIKVCDYFYLDEFFPKDICDEEGINAMVRIDKRLPVIADRFRDIVGKPTWINNWIHGGDIDEAGWRSPLTTTGAKMSAHKQIWKLQGVFYSIAQDYHVSKMSGQELYHIIEFYAKEFYELGVRRMEHYQLTPGWCHLDLKETGITGIQVVNLKSIANIIKF